MAVAKAYKAQQTRAYPAGRATATRVVADIPCSHKFVKLTAVMRQQPCADSTCVALRCCMQRDRRGTYEVRQIQVDVSVPIEPSNVC